MQTEIAYSWWYILFDAKTSVFYLLDWLKSYWWDASTLEEAKRRFDEEEYGVESICGYGY